MLLVTVWKYYNIFALFFFHIDDILYHLRMVFYAPGFIDDLFIFAYVFVYVSLLAILWIRLLIFLAFNSKKIQEVFV